MTSKNWKRISDTFKAVATAPPSSRNELIKTLCEGDIELEREVSSLLDAHDSATGFLEQESPDILPRLDLSGSGLEGQTIGSYQVQHSIGHGGMGEVYLAQRNTDDFEQLVALKVLHPGSQTTDARNRFLRERRILSKLNHPNICPLLDGGVTDDGRPYFAMPYLEGALPIHAYCREHGVELNGRITLLEKVADAVQYAHQHLVVHADLKPSNVLVTPDGEPVLVDFGIARLLAASETLGDAELTQGPRPLTANYASPEQFRGESPTTHSDVYALGLLLFELLTDSRPFAESALGELEARQDPPRPSGHCAGTAEVFGTTISKLRKQLREDLDNIVLTALQYAPEDRYPSVSSFVLDLQAWQKGLPVSAQAPSWAYLGRKFYRRHQVGVATAFSALLLLVVFSAAISFFNIRLQQESEARQIALQQSEAVARFWAGLFKEADPLSYSTEEQVLSIHELMVRAVDQLSADQSDLGPVASVRILLELAMTLWSRGDRDTALHALAQAVKIADAQSQPHFEFAYAYSRLSSFSKEEGDIEKAVGAAERSLEIAEKLPDLDAETFGTLLNAHAIALKSAGRWNEAIASYQKSVFVLREAKPTPEILRNLATTLTNFGGMYIQYGKTFLDESLRNKQLQKAEPLLAEALDLFVSELGRDHPRVAFVKNNYSGLLGAQGKDKQALPYAREALETLVASFPPSSPQVLSLSLNLANTYLRLGMYAQAQEIGTESLGNSKPAWPDDNQVVVRLAACSILAASAQGKSQLAAEVYGLHFSNAKPTSPEGEERLASWGRAARVAQLLGGESETFRIAVASLPEADDPSLAGYIRLLRKLAEAS